MLINKPTKPIQSLTTWYLTEVKNNNLFYNEAQLEILHQLDDFAINFNSMYGKSITTNKLIQQLIYGIVYGIKSLKYLLIKSNSSNSNLGYYIYGNVGRGKTMIMNQLFEIITTPKKIRTHFHQFMNDIQKQLTVERNMDDPLEHIAATLAVQYKIIFLDEMHINDIATAMILNKLFCNLFKHGIYVITSSNYLPDDLYKDGLMRERFIPAINLIKAKLHTLELKTEEDYRTIQVNTNTTNTMAPNDLFIINQSDTITTNKLNNIFNHIIAQNQDMNNTNTNNQLENKTIIIKNRPIPFIKQHNHIIWFDFKVICGSNRSQLDYLELIQQFNWIIIQNIGSLTLQDKDIARRFTWLIDILYDSKSKLALSSSVPIDMIFSRANIANEFQRTLSRLTEMQTNKYINTIPTGIGILVET